MQLSKCVFSNLFVPSANFNTFVKMKQHLNFRNKAFNRLFPFFGHSSLPAIALGKHLTKNPIGFLSSSLTFLVFFMLLFLEPSSSFSQIIDVVNKGLPIKNSNNSIIIYGNVTHELDGNITNDGNFYIKGDWINNNPSGNIFTSGSNGWVHLDSAAQTIGGSNMTHFNNLELAGTGIKQLSNVDAEIEDSLVLHDHEFAAGGNTVFVLSPSTGVITRTTGFVSNTNDGGLSRNTLAMSPYFFPVGSSTGTPRFRPVDITPNDASANTFKVRMANDDATLEGFDRTIKESAVGGVNPKFYHRINRTNGVSLADITIYFDKIADSTYDIIAHWQNVPQWENTGTADTSSAYGFSGLTKKAFNDFSFTPFALSTFVEGGATVFVPNVFSPNGDGFNDLLRVRGRGITELDFVIYDRWGEKVFETNDVNAGWDGTYKGQPMNLAVFVYIIKGKFKNGDAIDKKGNFTLLR